MRRSVLVVGAGLVGTSAGLALRAAEWQVHLVDEAVDAQRLAVDLGAGAPGAPTEDPDVVLVAVPPRAVASVVEQLIPRYLTSTFSDVSSIKAKVEHEIEALGAADRFVGGHPMAGRERSGPSAARADLFEGRPWVICPTEKVAGARVALIAELATACGARALQMSARAHDHGVALVSHAPQLVASSMAARLLEARAGEVDLAGQGLRDTVRVAASDPDLWVDIVAGNAESVAEVLKAVASDLFATVRELRELRDHHTVESSTYRDIDKSVVGNIGADDGVEQLRSLLTRGQQGYARIPGKHGIPARSYAVVPVVIPDEPGALARLLVSAGEAGINVEDISIEHSPGQPVGLVELAVEPAAAESLSRTLTAMGWSVH